MSHHELHCAIGCASKCLGKKRPKLSLNTVYGASLTPLVEEYVHGAGPDEQHDEHDEDFVNLDIGEVAGTGRTDG